MDITTENSMIMGKLLFTNNYSTLLIFNINTYLSNNNLNYEYEGKYCTKLAFNAI